MLKLLPFRSGRDGARKMAVFGEIGFRFSINPVFKIIVLFLSVSVITRERFTVDNLKPAVRLFIVNYTTAT